MKVLVYYEQEYSIKSRFTIRNVEYISKVFDVTSKEDLLLQFDSFKFIPTYLSKTPSLVEIKCKKKTMIWYLPENFQPHF